MFILVVLFIMKCPFEKKLFEFKLIRKKKVNLMSSTLRVFQVFAKVLSITGIFPYQVSFTTLATNQPTSTFGRSIKVNNHNLLDRILITLSNLSSAYLSHMVST
jgi:Rad3-related DNA helicase